VVFVAGARTAAIGQSSLNYRTANPRALVTALKSAPDAERNNVAEAMIARRAEVLPVLRESAQSGDRMEKVLACSMIAEMRDRGSLDAVLAASADRDVVVRRRAATVLRILADGRARPRLRALLQSESDLGVLKSAIAALGGVGQRRDVANIEPFIRHADLGVRVTAAGALAMLGDQRGLDLVIQATFDADPGIQKNATYILGLFSATAAGDRLQAILDDPAGAWKGYALVARGQRLLAKQSLTEQVTTLDGLAHGRSRTLAEWAVDRLTDIGNADAIAILRTVRERPTPVGRLAERRLLVLGVQP
jgi:HEAT repeat protein